VSADRAWGMGTLFPIGGYVHKGRIAVSILAGAIGATLTLAAASHVFGAEARLTTFWGLAAMFTANATALVLGLAFGTINGAFRRRDEVTGFMLKPALLQLAGEHLARATAGKSDSALILCELSALSGLVRVQGRAAEEQIIREASHRLAALLPKNALAARWGEETFVIFVPAAGSAMAMLNLARAITGSLAAGIEISGIKLASAPFCGIARGPADGATVMDLFRSAELALEQARKQGKPGYGFFSPELAAISKRQLAVQRAVAHALENKAFHLDFQPTYDMRSGELTGFEALIRLHDAELGPIPPAEFIPIAEQEGLIVAIGEWALDEACRIAAQWPPHLMVAVNLSPVQLLSGAIVNTIRDVLARHSLPAYRLEIEITEGILLTESEMVLHQLTVLRDMGVAVALDDFGTGYSSLSYLWKFPFSKLKIDRSFAAALDVSPPAKGIVRSIVRLGHGLGMMVTAEGIETESQLAVLREAGCDLAQGFLLGRPAHETELAAIILRNFAEDLKRKAKNTGRSAA
jgi:EAL domain-containing protein (putative c-di-GMP-specific phosphodiesterase class I)/GGDEF domain-containing protein